MRADLYYKTQVSLSFCDSKPHPKPKGKKKSGIQVNCLCCPIFNKDGSYATNTFILPDEKVPALLFSKITWKIKQDTKKNMSIESMRETMKSPKWYTFKLFSCFQDPKQNTTTVMSVGVATKITGIT